MLTSIPAEYATYLSDAWPDYCSLLYRIAQRVNLQGGRLNERAIRAPAGATYEVIAMKRNGSFAALIFMLILGAGAVLAYATYRVSAGIEALVVIGCALILAIFISSGIQVADQWSRAVVLRLGKFRSLQGPGLFLIIPVVDSIPYWIDTRVLTSSFKAEKTLTKDTVPVDVDAVLFWKIVDPKKAALDVADYQSAISWASQTALRDVIGKTMLSDMLEGRDKISDVLRKIIDERTEPWGINVISVEVKDVLIPASLEDAMSMQAQAERERQARVILGDSERQVAEKFGEAAKTYMNNPVALHLRAMNMLYEGLKANSTIVIVPSTAVESMQLGGLAGLTALTMGLGQEQTRTKNDKEPVISNIPTPAQESDLIPVSRADTMAGPASARENGSLITTPR
jgi:regulator of protease activity HflC (stomatin/prohibitin superfamily)